MKTSTQIGDFMTFWIISTGLAVAVAALFTLALRAPKRGTAVPAAAYDLKVYRDQLRTVDKDVVRGVVGEADAERLRTEISRRILAADAALTTDSVEADSKKGAPVLMGAVLAVFIVGGSLWLYVGSPSVMRFFGATDSTIERTKQALEIDVRINIPFYDVAFTVPIDAFPDGLGAPGYGDLGLKDRIALAEEARANRPNQQEAENSLPAYVPPPDASPDYIALVERLRTAIKERPDDLQGHILLAQNEANLGNFRAAAIAQGKVVEIRGDEATAEDLTNHGDMLIIAAGGYVSPEAEAALSRALRIDPSNGTARYYMGLMLAQTGRPDAGFRLWDKLLRDGPADAPWIEPILAQIQDLSLRAGVKYQIPEIGNAIPTQRGPSGADIEAAGEMSPSDRMTMIESMVQGLADRLATEGGPVEDWAQLIAALGVLGQTSEARSVYENSVQVFAGDKRALDVLLRAGQQAQVAE